MLIENLGGGTVRFVGALEVPQDDVLAYLVREKLRWKKENFSIIKDDNGNPIHAVNKGGFIYDLEDIDRSPVRIQKLEHEFFRVCDETIYKCLLEYVEIFPAILQSLWWRSTGHVLCYEEGAALGFHSDNDVNYRYGAEPREQHATRNVISALAYLNDSTDDESVPYSFSGGHMEIPYFDIDITPRAGDIVLMPANYLGAHLIKPVTRGSRYSYLSWFAQGSADEHRGIAPRVSETYYHNDGQWWLNTILDDYENHLINKFGDIKKVPEKLIAFKERKDDHK